MNAKPLRIDWRGRTDRGSVRENNEDCYAAVPEAGIWLVADGMGGHERGDWASERLADAVGKVAPTVAFDDLVLACSAAIHEANRAIFAAATADGITMGSTVVCLMVSDRRFCILWAGDSRAYLLRDDRLIPLTRDHTQVQVLVERGILSPEEAETHPMSHVLAKAVGAEAELELDAIVDAISPGDMFLLCSDGLHGTIDSEEIRAIMAGGTAHDAAERLIDRCLEVGAGDNVTAVVAQALEPTILMFAATSSGQDGDGE